MSVLERYGEYDDLYKPLKIKNFEGLIVLKDV
jgi:hypothetical protein